MFFCFLGGGGANVLEVVVREVLGQTRFSLVTIFVRALGTERTPSYSLPQHDYIHMFGFALYFPMKLKLQSHNKSGGE